MNLSKQIEKTKEILSHPSKFFDNLKKEKGIKTAFTYFAILSFVYFFLYLVLLLIFNNGNSVFTNLSKIFPIMNSFNIGIPLQLFILTISSYIFELVFSFVGAALLHVWILIFGGKGKYTQTYQLSIYSSTPSLLFGWIPFLGSTIGLIYSLYLLIVGTQKIYKISKMKTLWMYIFLPLIFVLLITIFLSAFVILYRIKG